MRRRRISRSFSSIRDSRGFSGCLRLRFGGVAPDAGNRASAIGALPVRDPVLEDMVAAALDEQRAAARAVSVLPPAHAAREVSGVDELEPGLLADGGSVHQGLGSRAVRI